MCHRSEDTILLEGSFKRHLVSKYLWNNIIAFISKGYGKEKRLYGNIDGVFMP